MGSISLDKYIPKFTENGIEDLETILELNDTHLDAMGVPLGYKLKILKQIKAVRLQEGMEAPQSRQQSRMESRPQSATSAKPTPVNKEKKVAFAPEPEKSDNLLDGP